MNYSFLTKSEDGKVIFNGHKLNIYIPYELFANGYSEYQGMKIQTLGIFIFGVKPTETSSETFYLFNFPGVMNFSYTNKTIFTGQLTPKLSEDKYQVFELEDGDMFMEKEHLVKTYQNTDKLVKMINAGKLPASSPYSSIIKLLIDSMILNNADLRVPYVLLEGIIGTQCRDANNLNMPFRRLIGTDEYNDEFGYRQVSIKDLAVINSTFTAMTSENMDRTILASIEKAHDPNNVEEQNPIEDTLKYLT